MSVFFAEDRPGIRVTPATNDHTSDRRSALELELIAALRINRRIVSISEGRKANNF